MTGARSGSGSLGTFTVVDLGEAEGSKNSVSDNAVMEREVFTLMKLLPADAYISATTTFVLYGDNWSFVSSEITPGNIGLFMIIRRVNG